MARIVVTTFGSTGDLNPFIALALALRSRGHDVIFAVEANFQQQVSELGFPTHVLTGDQQKALASYSRQIFNDDSSLTALKLLMEHYILPTLPAKVAELRAICQQADLLISAAPQFASSIVANQLHMPWIPVILTPATLPSASLAAQPLTVQLHASLQRLSNRFSWFLGGIFLRQVVDKPINRLRQQFQVPPRSNLMWTGNLSPRLTALAISPAFISRPADWPEYVKMTGFCFWDRPTNWQFPGTLKAFLNGDKPVVAVTAGTVVAGERALFSSYYQTSIESIRACNARVLLINAPANILSTEQGEDVFRIPFAPFSEVFPACAAVIHHGGIGTIAQCLRAGVPSLVVSGGLDQPFNAAQIVQRKVGLWIPRKHFTTRRAEQALKALLSRPIFTQNAREIQNQVLQEDGAATLCTMAEQVLNDSSA